MRCRVRQAQRLSAGTKLFAAKTKVEPIVLRVLIVDDSTEMREALSDWLDALGGYRVVGTAASEMEATEWLQQHPNGCDVAVVDLLITSGSGFNLIKRATQSASSAQVVIFSAYVTPVIAQRCVHLGAAAAFNKSEPEKMLDFLGGLTGQGGGALQRRQ